MCDLMDNFLPFFARIFRSLLTYTATTVKLSATPPPFQHLCMHADGVNTFVAFFSGFPSIEL
jgi:predicted SnoaL-like aldol condensation-catalyzing enzyme